jgi:hypothetical protein
MFRVSRQAYLTEESADEDGLRGITRWGQTGGQRKHARGRAQARDTLHELARRCQPEHFSFDESVARGARAQGSHGCGEEWELGRGGRVCSAKAKLI